MNTTGP